MSHVDFADPPFAVPTDKFTAGELRECAEREVRLRRRVYLGRVATKRMSEREAARQIEMMEAIAEHFRAIENKGMLV